MLLPLREARRFIDAPRPGLRERNGLECVCRLVGQHEDAVREDKGFLDIMRDEDHGLARFPPDPDDFLAHPPSRVGIERGERLVHQDDLRFDRKRPGDGDALALPAGEHRRILVHVLVQPDHRQQPFRGRAHLGLRPIAEAKLHAEFDIAPRRAPGHETRRLEYIGKLVPALFRRKPHDGHVAALGRKQVAHQPQRRRLPAPARSEDTEKLPLLDRKAQPVIDRLGVEPDNDVLER